VLIVSFCWEQASVFLDALRSETCLRAHRMSKVPGPSVYNHACKAGWDACIPASRMIHIPLGCNHPDHWDAISQPGMISSRLDNLPQHHSATAPQPQCHSHSATATVPQPQRHNHSTTATATQPLREASVQNTAHTMRPSHQAKLQRNS